MESTIYKIINEINNKYRIGCDDLKPGITERNYFRLESVETQTSQDKLMSLREASLEYGLSNISEEEYNRIVEDINKIEVDDSDMGSVRVNAKSKNLEKRMLSITLYEDTRQLKHQLVRTFKEDLSKMLSNIQQIDIHNKTDLLIEANKLNQLYRLPHNILCSDTHNMNLGDVYNKKNYRETPLLDSNDMLLCLDNEGIVFFIDDYKIESGPNEIKKLNITYVLDILDTDATRILKIKEDYDNQH